MRYFLKRNITRVTVVNRRYESDEEMARANERAKAMMKEFIESFDKDTKKEKQ